MSINTGPPANWSVSGNQYPYVTHNSPSSQTPNQIKLDLQTAAKDALRIYSESTHPVIPSTSAWAFFEDWGVSWGGT